ncbi:RICIN domain-containing protein [Streptomyces sp. NBC_00847]|uniref:RICIN domain-containing protein n=1 Tax=Streptomyces sp. NBC_00847 TaxID=2975850 RepID=UPI00225BA4E0|nr:RICIN domain-containing protein [Streptomyces sp. NBC_00847]MCX4882224.1 RICIN domain-containing protein [Streptomyces sp. NBC_00847]
MLAGALMAGATPAIAHTQSPQGADPTPSSQDAVGTSRLKNLKSGKYLQPVSTANGAKVVQQSRDADNYLQSWSTVTYDGHYTFENFKSGLNLGIDGASSAVGAAAITAKGSSDRNQDWLRDYTPYDGDYFRLINRKSALCLGISGASTANGAQAAQFPCDGSANQGWVDAE